MNSKDWKSITAATAFFMIGIGGGTLVFRTMPLGQGSSRGGVRAPASIRLSALAPPTAPQGGARETERLERPRLVTHAPAGTTVPDLRRSPTRDDPYDGFAVIDEDMTVPDIRGIYMRWRVVRAEGFKYPVIRVVDRMLQDPETGRSRILSQSAMVGDHLIVSPRSPDELAIVRELASRLGGDIREEFPTSGILLISFDGNMAHAMDQMASSLKADPSVRVAEPDYIVHAD